MKFLQNHKRWLIGGFAISAMALIVWLVGPLIDIGDPRLFEAPGRRGFIIILIVLSWLSWEGVRLWRQRRSNRELIDQLGQVEDPDAAQSREEAEALRGRFTEALDTLKSTRLGGGARMLYQLPWYMFIGAPGSGKTTALVNSGLKFPLAQAGVGGAALGGIGGTRNCDWWFTDDAVLIDTAGRYTTQDSNAKVDQAAWGAFLDLLKRYRPRQPINGILVTLSIGDLLTQEAGERESYARVVRQRIEDLQRHLGLQFPVYVFVTKCDLISGFNEFFSGWNAEQRAQVWGTTFDFDLKTRTAGDAIEGFSKTFPGLVTRLNQLLLDRLQDERDPERRVDLYSFPQQFASIGPLVTEFLEAAFSDSKYSIKPIVRGLYFTSGTQQGAPIDRVLASLANALALGGAGSRKGVPQGMAKSYFIQKVLTQVVFPEAGLAGHSEQREQRLRLLNWGLIGLCGLLGIGLTIAWTASYLNNREGLQRAEAVAQSARASLVAVPAPSDNDLPVLVDALNQLQKIPISIHDPVDQPVLAMRWGLYQGRKVDDQVQERFRFALQQGLLPRIALQLERIMAAPQSKPEYVYAALKTYIMLYERERLERGFFMSSVSDLWGSMGMDAGVRELAVSQLRALIEAGDLQVERFHPRNRALETSARERVAGLSLSDRTYNNLLRLSEAGGAAPLRLSELVGPSGVAVFERTSGVSMSEPVPLIFTREGYRKVAKPRIRELVTELGAEEAWVLGRRSSGMSDSDIIEVEGVVQRRLLVEYQSFWQGVLSDLRVRRIDGIKTAMSTAQTLGQSDSPLKRLVTAVADQTRLSTPDLQAEAGAAAGEAAVRKLKETATSATSGIFGSQAAQIIDRATHVRGAPARSPEQDLEEQFSHLRRLVGDGKSGDIDSALTLINEIYNELVAMQQKISSGQGIVEIPQIFGRAEGQATRYGDPVTKAILALSSYAKREASGGVQKEVKVGVGGASSVCQRAIPGRYPFSRSAAQDVGVQDFVNVFKVGGDLDTYFQSNLAQYVDKSGGVWRLKASGEGAPPVSAGTLRQFQNAEVIRTAFLSGGAAASVVVDVSVVSGDAEVGLDYDGANHKLRVGSGSARLAWPARPGIQLSINGQPAVSADGAWALFRLIDKGARDPSSTGDRIRVGYAAASGSRAVLEVRAGSAAFNPFRLRELDSFGCPRE